MHIDTCVDIERLLLGFRQEFSLEEQPKKPVFVEKQYEQYEHSLLSVRQRYFYLTHNLTTQTYSIQVFVF